MKRISLIIVSALMTGCLGQNALFNSVQDWNATATEEKIVNQGISFLFWWVPVYSLTLLGDIVIFNWVEFWTGQNPISQEGAKVTDGTRIMEDGLGNHAELACQDNGTVQVTEYREGEVLEYCLVRDSAGTVSIDGFSPSVAMNH